MEVDHKFYRTIRQTLFYVALFWRNNPEIVPFREDASCLRRHRDSELGLLDPIQELRRNMELYDSKVN